MSSQKKVVCYTGIGSKNSAIHTDEEFAKIIRTEFKKDCKKDCPKVYNEWVTWSGAEIKSKKECKDIVRSNKNIDKKAKKADKATKKLDICITKNKCIRNKCDETECKPLKITKCISSNCKKELQVLKLANKEYHKSFSKMIPT